MRLNLLLIIESKNEVEDIAHSLQSAGYEVACSQAATLPAASNTLENQTWDVIILDEAIPITVPDMTRWMKTNNLDAVLIVISATPDEERARQAMVNGAQDYLNKTNLARFPLVIERELHVLTLRRANLHLQEWIFGEDNQVELLLQAADNLLKSKRAERQIYYQAQLLESVSDAIIGTDLEFRIRSWNKAAEAIYGFGAEEVIGKTIAEVIPTAFLRGSQEESIQELFEQGNWRGEVIQIHKDGTPLYILASVSLVRDNIGDPIGIVAVNHDITEWREAEEARHEQYILTESLHDTALVLLGAELDLSHVLDRILDTVARVVSYDTANIMLVDGNVARVVGYRGYDKYGISGDILSQIEFPTSESTGFGQMLYHRQPYLVADTQLAANWLVFPEVAWIRSYVGIPIIIQDEVIGFLSLDSPTPNTFTEEHVDRLQTFATHAALAIRIAQLFEKLRDSEARYRSVIEGQTELICQFLPDYRLTFVNDAWRSFTGKTPEALLELEFTSLIPPYLVQELQATVDAITPDTPAQNCELFMKRGDESDVWIAWTIRAVTINAANKVGKYQAVGRDITQRKQAEIELLKALEKEKELAELQARFVTTASHEFRTPLAIIMAASEALQHYWQKMEPTQINNRLDKIHQQIRHITALLEKVLAISRIQTEPTTLQPILLDLDIFCRQVIEEAERSDDARHTIAYTCSDRATLSHVVIDQRLFGAILHNLLSNALNYSPAGSTVFVDLSYEQNRLLLRVKDQGMGINEKDQPHIYETFWRGANVHTISGTGLGLAITKHAVELLRGTITFETTVNIGTTFCVTLPILSGN